MKLEVNRIYETSDGDHVTIRKKVNDSFIGFYLCKDNDWELGRFYSRFSVWKEDGMPFDDHDPKLVKEWKPEHKSKEMPLAAWLTRSPSCVTWSIFFAPIDWKPTGTSACKRAEWLDEPIVTHHDPGEEHA